MFLESFDKIGSMSGKHNIKLEPNILPVQHERCRVSLEAKEEIEAELKEMTTQGINTPQVKLAPRFSSLTYPCKPNGTLRVYLSPRDLNRAIICEHQKPPTLVEIIYKFASSSTCSKLETNVFWKIQLAHKSS